jgi:hypothetical protein
VDRTLPPAPVAAAGGQPALLAGPQPGGRPADASDRSLPPGGCELDPDPASQAAQPLRKVRDRLSARGVEGSVVFCRAANRWWRGCKDGAPAQGTTEDGLGGGGAGPGGRRLAGAHPCLGSTALICAFHVLRPPGQCRGRKPG